MIGIFDSGTGGLSIYWAIKKLMPEASCLYFADHAHFPYGEKTVHQIKSFSSLISSFLISQGANIIVVACNTATIAAIKHLRESFQVPFVGTVPAVKPACLYSMNKKTAVLLTQTAARGGAFHHLVSSHANGAEVYTIRSSRLVKISEEQLQSDPSSIRYLAQILDPLLEKGVDALVLGSTHFIFLKPWIEELYPGKFKIFDPSEGVAKQTQRLYLLHRSSMSQKIDQKEDVFFTSGSSCLLSQKIKKLLLMDVSKNNVQQVLLDY